LNTEARAWPIEQGETTQEASKPKWHWRLPDTQTTDFCIEAVKEAIN
jgi:hypothetical protein